MDAPTSTTTIYTIIGTLATYITANKWIVPLIVNQWNTHKERKSTKDKQTLDVNKELLTNKEIGNDVYENQILFLVGQIDVLQNKLIDKQKEIDGFSKELTDLRKKVMELQSSLFNSKLIINKLNSLGCGNMDCKFRQIGNLPNEHSEDGTNA